MLGARLHAASAAYAVVGLAHRLHGLVVLGKVAAPLAGETLLLGAYYVGALQYAVVVELEYSRNVYAVRAGHAVLAAGAARERELHPVVGNLFQQLELAVGQRLEVAEGLQVDEELKCLPAKLEITEDGKAYLTIAEGKFHQVKRMMERLGGKVTYLKRLEFGPLVLDEDLKPGEYRELSEKEIEALKGR